MNTVRVRTRLIVFLVSALFVICVFSLIHVVMLLNHPREVEMLGDRATFMSGACAEYAPTGKNLHRTVFIDPGHGGPDPGASGSASDGTVLQEKRLTLAVARDMVSPLRASGFQVVLSRLDDIPVVRPGPGSLDGTLYTPAGEHADIVGRIECANTAHAQLLLSIHFNSFPDPTVGGAETAYDPSRPFSAQSQRFAALVQHAIITAMAQKGWAVPNRGAQSDVTLGTPALTEQGAQYGHLLELGPAAPGWLAQPSQMPGALTEPLFLTDPGEANVIETREGQEVLAEALTRAINDYFGTG